MNTRIRRLSALLLSIIMCLVIAGCGSKVNKDNVAKVKIGMTQKEVEDVLGTGTVTDSAAAAIPGVAGVSTKTETWKSGDKSITVTYVNDKATTVTSSGL